MIAFKKAKPVHSTSLLFLHPLQVYSQKGAMLFHNEIVPGGLIATL